MNTTTQNATPSTNDAVANATADKKVEAFYAKPFQLVDQTGTGNNANNVVQRGPAGGSNGFTPPPGS